MSNNINITFSLIARIFIITGIIFLFAPFITISFAGMTVTISGIDMVVGRELETLGKIPVNWLLVLASILLLISFVILLIYFEETLIKTAVMSIVSCILIIVYGNTYKEYYGWNDAFTSEFVETSWGYIVYLVCAIISGICTVLDGIGLSEKIFNNDYSTNINHPSSLSNYSNQLIATQQHKEGYWKCLCGQMNPPHTTGCSCGLSVSEINKKKKQQEKEETERKEFIQKATQKAEIEKKVVENITAERNNIALLKEYKELLDSGIITQEEFDKKKHELLKL